MALILLVIFSGCAKNGDNENNSQTYDAVYSVVLKDDSRLPVSGHLMGFNLVYPQEKQSIWQDGKVTEHLKNVNTSIIRWPGGTVTSYYHWDSLTGRGWEDSWNPENSSVPEDGSEFMDFDEYMELVRTTGVTPLVGINVSSGRRWNRSEEGINEALSLMQYSKGHNFDIQYWYLDNEPYMHDSNGGDKTIEEYAELINMYATEMREFDPGIKIVVNWRQAFNDRRLDYQKLLEIAGDNIDVIDVHWYWSWGDPNMDKWLSSTPMKLHTGVSYIDEIAYFRDMVSDFGYPDIKLASLEWNVGLGGDDEFKLTSGQMAMIQSEMMMQYILGGLDMATFWPLHWPSENIITRSFVDPLNGQAQPNSHIFQVLGQLQDGAVIEEDITEGVPNTLNLIAIDANEDAVSICFLNKNDYNVGVNLTSKLFNERVLVDSYTFTPGDSGNGEMKALTLPIQEGENASFVAPKLSITMLTFKK